MLPLSDRIQQANALLHPLAVPHDGRLGRIVLEPDDLIRFPFERDRQRIIHSTAFRRLQGKTQVFTPGEGDHFRTRLTHSMEVAQISRSIARALQLNEDLAECTALAHDLGHPPFGHSGEDAIDTWMRAYEKHFEHNLQTHRIVTVLEHRSSLYEGLNLNREVEEGLLKHETLHPLTGKTLEPSLEASVTDLADECAYCAHDMEDGLNAELFFESDLQTIPLVEEALAHAAERGTGIAGGLLHLLIRDIVESSGDLRGGIHLSQSMRTALNEVHSFLEQRMYMHPMVHQKATNGAAVVDRLCRHYLDHPHEKIRALQQRTGSDLIVAVKDYVAGMTDNFAQDQRNLI